VSLAVGLVSLTCIFKRLCDILDGSFCSARLVFITSKSQASLSTSNNKSVCDVPFGIVLEE